MNPMMLTFPKCMETTSAACGVLGHTDNDNLPLPCSSNWNKFACCYISQNLSKRWTIKFISCKTMVSNCQWYRNYQSRFLISFLMVQVGDGNTDHYCWQRPEDMTTNRQAYRIDASNPGSDLAGETAAAMASASIVFRRSNPAYSNQLINHAKQV